MKPIYKIWTVYMLIMIFMIVAGTSYGQIKVVQYNAECNKDNSADWISKLTDVKTKAYVDIGKDMEAQKKYKISVVPTIIVFKDDEEVARFQADLSFKMVATREEVQEEINNQLMSDF